MVAEAAVATPVTPEMVPLLRKWAIAVVRHILQDQPLKNIPLSSEEMHFLATATPLDVKPKRSLLQRLGIQTALLPMRRSARRRLWKQPSKWHQRIMARAALGLQRGDDRFVADFWQPLAQAAWGDTQVVVALNVAMQSFWRQRSLFPQGVMPLCHVDVNTYWLLLLLHARESDNATPVLLRRLTCVVQQQCMVPGWARFWDQWLLWRMIQMHPNAVNKISKRMRSALQILPFFKLASPTSEPQQHSGRLRRLWRRLVRIFLMIVPAFAAVPTQILAHRGWQRDMPDFLYNHHLPRKRRKE